ncbi:hypothetical protein Pcinc_043712 [Petrolisthes cinctipes]|uniref:Uncharacterized protein n=1 Tax=Petrolisthes cinctipes TaxID=88211 RepID=A0AAE1EEU5_PETCI|nr:hypothetical protein Pcinc_043712 [Petrolisthes cinctipes]
MDVMPRRPAKDTSLDGLLLRRLLRQILRGPGPFLNGAVSCSSYPAPFNSSVTGNCMSCIKLPRDSPLFIPKKEVSVYGLIDMHTPPSPSSAHSSLSLLSTLLRLPPQHTPPSPSSAHHSLSLLIP